MLSAKLVEHGGNTLLIRQLTLPSGAALLDQVAQHIASMYFPILRSEIEKRAAETSLKKGNEPDSARDDARYFWDTVGIEETYGIPVLSFSNLREEYPELPVIPAEITKQFPPTKSFRELSYPLIVSYQGNQYIVVNIYDDYVKNAQDELEVGFISLAETKYFDLEH
jgi:hypothetical protein